MTSNKFKEIAKQTHEKFSLLNATNVFPGLWLGTMYAASDNEFLINNNIKYILTISENEEERSEINNSINRIYIPMRDESNFNAMKHFPKTCQYIDTALKPRFQQAKNEIISKENIAQCVNKNNFDNILVHCQLGISRSATIVSAYLLYKYYEYNTQTNDDIDTRKILQHLLKNDSIVNGKINDNKSTEKSIAVNVPFDDVSSVIKYLQHKRPIIKPNNGFERQLQLWQSKLVHNYNKDLQKKKLTPSSKKKEENQLSNSLEYFKIYSISKCNDIKYKYLSKKKSSIKNKKDSNNETSIISKEDVAKKLNL